MKELLLCALAQHGKPATAGELADLAIGLAQSAGWPRRSWAGLTAQSVAAILRGIERNPVNGTGGALGAHGVSRAGERNENGRAVPLWVPTVAVTPSETAITSFATYFNPCAPMPPTPDPLGDEHPLHGKNLRQQFVLFDALDNLVAAHGRMHAETVELVQRHTRELSDFAAKIKRELVAVGLDDAR